MPLKFSKSKIDISNFQRKVKAIQPKVIIRRDVIAEELRFAYRTVKKKVTAVAPPIVVETMRPLAQVLTFGLVMFGLVLIMQGFSFLSSANKAKGEILGVATSAYQDLDSAGQNLGSQNFDQAQNLFGQAQSNISLAQNKLNAFLPLSLLSPQADSANHLLAGANFLAEAGSELTSSLSLLSDLKLGGQTIATTNFIQTIATNRQSLAETRDLVSQASNEFNAVGSVPADYSDTLSQAKSQVSELGTILDKLVGLETLYLDLFNGQKTYMLIFQNADEERATGGFIGTYGTMDTNNGAVSNMQIQSIYQLDGQIFDQIAAPGPEQPAIARWGIRDSNWFVDFPTSSQKILSFLEDGQESADGIISATPQFFEDLLNLVGPIQMDEYNVTLTADNFQQIVQYETSVNYDKTLNQPKKFLADFAPILLDKLSHLSKEQMLQALQIVQDNLNDRSLMLYSKDPNTENEIQTLGYGGQLLATDYDYLSLNNSNLGGTKTDLSMNQNVNLQSKILSDGSIMDTLTIDRQNQASESNKDYLRILVPLGSSFISATGFSEYDYHDSNSPGLNTDPDLAAWDKGNLASNVYTRTESGKTEFAGWSLTDPGHDQVLTVSYMLPFKADSSYSLLLQKQAGAKAFQFAGNIDLGDYNTTWLGDGVSQVGHVVGFSSNTNTDDFWPMVISK